MKDVENKVAFITGGASGIGLGIAKAFLGTGMKVVIADIRQDHIDDAMADLAGGEDADNVHALPLDVTDRAAIQAAAEETERRFGKIHVLVNNAGVGITGSLKEATFDDWDWGMGVNLDGVINGIVIFLPFLLKHGEGGYIINTASMAAIVPIRIGAIYAAAKGAILCLSEEMRGELEADNIGVSAFCPGPVQTNIREAGKLRPEKYKKGSGLKEFEERLATRPNDPRWMTMEEVGERVLEGMRNNEIYIMSHREFKEGAKERFDAMLASFPDEAINEERLEAIRWLTHNDIYTDYLKKKGRA